MIGVNLIPANILEAHRRSRRIRLWLAATVVAALVAAAPVLWQVRQQTRLAELSELKRARDTELANIKTHLAEVTHSLADLNERIERADALRTKRSWAGLLTMMVQCMPDKVWLTSVATDAVTRPAATPTTPEEGSDVVVLDGARRVGLSGFAIDHEQLYDFMTRLKQSAAFDHVELLKADKEPVLWSRAVRFELICAW